MACPANLSLSACRDFLLQQEQFFNYISPIEWGRFALQMLAAFLLVALIVLLEPLVTERWRQWKRSK